MDGKTRYFDPPIRSAQADLRKADPGRQVNIISQSWDGKRVYITSSLLANWDKGGADNEQFLRGFTWNGKDLKQVFGWISPGRRTRRAITEAGVEGVAYALRAGKLPPDRAQLDNLGETEASSRITPAASRRDSPGDSLHALQMTARRVLTAVCSCCGVANRLRHNSARQRHTGPGFQLHPRQGRNRFITSCPRPTGRVLDVDGRTRNLSHFLQNEITLLGFLSTDLHRSRGLPPRLSCVQTA